jgi:multidrug efflux pump subunit AcrA (membrane-fusion protein)
MDRIIKKKWLTTAIALVIISFIMYPLYFNSNGSNYNKYTVVQVIKAKQASWYNDLPLVGTIAAEQYITFTAEIPGMFKKIADPTQIVAKDELIAVIKNSPVNTPANLNYDPSKFIAPFPGIVGDYQVRDRSLISPGQPIVSLINPDSLTVNFNIPEIIMQQIAVQQKVIINQQDFYVQHISTTPNPRTNLFTVTANYRCTKCRPGENIQLRLILQEQANILLIPGEAILTIDNQPYVYVAENHRAVLRAVTLGLKSQQQIEVVNGLQAGDLIIISNINQLENYSKIKIFENINQ